MRVSPLQFVVILLFVEIIAASPMEEQKSFHRQWPRIRLVLVRHGETEGNANGIVVGQETSVCGVGPGTFFFFDKMWH